MPSTLRPQATKTQVYAPILSACKSPHVTCNNYKSQSNSGSDDEFSDDVENKLVIDECDNTETRDTTAHSPLPSSPEHEYSFQHPSKVVRHPHAHHQFPPQHLQTFQKSKNSMTLFTLTQTLSVLEVLHLCTPL